MKILIACEYSGTVRDAFRKKGHNAWSCDVLKNDADAKYHYQQDVIPLLSEKWDMIIAFPPCTHLSVSGARWFGEKRKDGRQQQGIDFFMKFAECSCKKIAIENPVGIMSTKWRKPDQIIQPWMFGDTACKRTCLWLKGLPLLEPTNIVDKGEQVVFGSGRTMPKWYTETYGLPPEKRAKTRSKTFQGIANAMASQWAGPLQGLK